jgi:hypothetical protein
MQSNNPRCLFVNPPIYDFSAYDFWLRPLGLLTVAGMLRGQADLTLYDFLDRRHPLAANSDTDKDPTGRGKFLEQRVEKPAPLKAIPRYYKRFGLPADHFSQFLDGHAPFEYVFIQSVMTYWYPGVKEVIDTVRKAMPQAKVIVGGFYATACSGHAQSLGADVVIKGSDLEPLWKLMGLTPPKAYCPPAWELYPVLETGVMKLTQGCPFRCSYCYVPVRGERFAVRPLDEVVQDFEAMRRVGVSNIAFYDDALLHQPELCLYPFLDAVERQGGGVHFHTPNGMHARMIDSEMACRLVRGGMKTFYLGYESASTEFQKQTGSKLTSNDLVAAVDALRTEGAAADSIIAYEMLGHPLGDVQSVEESMRFASSLGIRVMLSEFSPIPGTPDGELCRKKVDLDEPLCHNKSAFPILSLGWDKVGFYKNLCRELNAKNRSLKPQISQVFTD